MTTPTKARKRAPQATGAATPSKHRRLARPATSKRAIEAARLRTEELIAVLAVRGKPIDRNKLSPTQRRCLEIGPYPRAAAVYLATHEKFVEAQVRKVSARHVPDEDVAQAVRLGMSRGLDKFDARLVDNGTVTSFLSYARWWVRCEVGKLLEDESLVRIPSAAKKTATELRQQLDAFAATIKEAPEYITDEDVAAALQLPLDKVKTFRHLHLGHEHYDATTLETHRDKVEIGEAATLMVHERIAEMQAEQAEDAAWKVRGGHMDLALEKLPALHRRVVAASYGLEADAAMASVKLPSSVIAVRTILKAAVGRLRQLMDVDVVGLVTT